MNQSVYVGGTSDFGGQNATIDSNGMVSFKSSNHANVIFYKKSVLDPVKSREIGRPIFISKDYVRIQHPGEADVIDRPIADDPRVTQVWGMQYQKFLNNQDHDIPDGTPVEMLFPNRPEIPANLHTQGVHTIEQLGSLTAHALQMIGMGAVEWQQAAKKFLDSSLGGAEYHKMKQEVETLLSQNQVLQNQVSLMKSQLDRLSAAQLGVPQHMIPNAAPTVAQQYMQSLPEIPIQEELELPAFRSAFPDTPPTAKVPNLRHNRKG